VDRFIEQADKFHPTMKFTAEISENEITFLDTTVFKGERFTKGSILDIKTHYKPTETSKRALDAVPVLWLGQLSFIFGSGVWGENKRIDYA